MAGDRKVERIKTLPFFANASKDAVQALARAADQVDVSAGRTLIQEGDVNLVAYIVEAGEAEVVVRGEAVATIDAGEMIGEVGFFSRGAATATVRAKTDMTVFSLPYNRFDSVLDENPAMLRAIAEELAHRLRDMDARHC